MTHDATNNSPQPVVIIGGGLSGLTCARTLQDRGIPFLLLESSPTLGGRVQSDTENGYIFDRGFQVLLTAYPEAQRWLDYEALDLQHFESGAMIRYQGRFYTVNDPFRDFFKSLLQVANPIGSFKDKLLVGKLRLALIQQTESQILNTPQQSTRDYLRGFGFSNAMLERFFEPFFGGVFLEKALNTSARKLQFLFQQFSKGTAALPRLGMGAITQQLAGPLVKSLVKSSEAGSCIRLNARVKTLLPEGIALDSGEFIEASTVILAADGASASGLFPSNPASTALWPPPPYHSATCLYFEVPESPIKKPILALNGDGKGLINNICVPSEVSSNYSQTGRALVSVTVLGNIEVHSSHSSPLAERVIQELTEWFPQIAKPEWRWLKTYAIQHALPEETQTHIQPVQKVSPFENGLTVIPCGDYRDIGSIHGAMRSGRMAGEAVSL
ncbi:MAG: FAD-dependent oxidoreductase [Cyanobacteria bacterium]|nr:FAD-dependent oxidoreductase [Cyanobacteriota bacterium]